MGGSILLGLFIALVVVVVIWSVRNDHARTVGEQKGLFRMREHSAPARAEGDPKRPGAMR